MDVEQPEFPTTFHFFVRYEPVPQPRERGRVAGKPPKQFVQMYTPTNHPVWNWKAAVADAWREVMPTPGYRMPGPLALAIRFLLPRPSTMVWKKRAMPRVYDTRRGAGDLDNLEKSIMDSLSARCWTDDCQVAAKYTEKWIAAGDLEQPDYHEPLSAEIIVTQLPNPPTFNACLAFRETVLKLQPSFAMLSVQAPTLPEVK